MQAVRALGNGAHDEQLCRNIAQHADSLPCLIKQMENSQVKHAPIHIEVCTALARLMTSDLIRKRFVADHANLQATVTLLNSRNDQVKVCESYAGGVSFCGFLLICCP